MSTRPLTVARNYLDLTKPRLLPMVLFTGLPVMGMASGGWPPALMILTILFGISLAAAAANTLNAYLEVDKDALMERTRERPLPAGKITPRAALLFGIALSIGAVAVLYAVSGLVAAGLGLASILFYVFVYTVWLKPRSIWNAVIGGAAGAAAPLIADAAVNGSVGAPGLCLFAVVFFWQPPHVWAIALYRKQDYAAAGIPMPPSVIGDQPTRWRIFWYTVGLVPVTLAPIALGLLGNLYLAIAVTVNAWFLWAAVRVVRERSDESARHMFRVSLVFLASIFLGMVLDLLLR